MIEASDVIRLYAVGFACGHLLSAIPMVVGSVMAFAINLMRGGA